MECATLTEEGLKNVRRQFGSRKASSRRLARNGTLYGRRMIGKEHRYGCLGEILKSEIERCASDWETYGYQEFAPVLARKNCSISSHLPHYADGISANGNGWDILSQGDELSNAPPCFPVKRSYARIPSSILDIERYRRLSGTLAGLLRMLS